jgi:hypothetical protein
MTRTRSPLAFALLAATIGLGPVAAYPDGRIVVHATGRTDHAPASPPGEGTRRAQRLEQKRRRRDLKRRGYR